MEQDVTGAASTPNEAPQVVSAVESAVASRDQAAYKEARRAERAGKPLEPTKPTASAAVMPDTPAASTDALPAPASEPGKPKDKGVKARNQELDSEIRDLQERLKLRRTLREEIQALEGVKSADSPAAQPADPTDDEYQRFMAMPDAPKLDQIGDYDKWSVLMSRFIAKATLREEREAEQQQHFGRRIESMVARGREAHEDFEAVLKDAQQLGVQFPPHVSQLVSEHDRGHEVAYALGQVFRDLRDPAKVDAVLSRLSGSDVSSTGFVPTPSVPSFTQAPAPPRVLGGKPADAADPIASAVARHDVAAFRAERARERQAALR